ncbi:MAG: glycine cleavage system protein GcvH [Peptostreptococcaceae bacterium]|nr:glycine cleavage system protein GcvH [Peptostreptococcaceae bacterium]
MEIKKELMYSKTHEWVKADGQKAYIGLTDYARIQLGQIVFIDLPEINSTAEAEQSLAEVESVKAVAEVLSPISGTVNEVNEALINNPELINEDVYGSWLVLIEMSDPAEINNLMNSEEYENFCKTLSEEESH